MSWADIPGWFGFRDTYDRAVALAQDGDTFVEVGVAFGRSVAYLSRAVIDSGKKVKIYAVDPWWDDWWHVPDQYPTHLERPTWGGEFSQMGRDLGGPFSAFCHLMRTHAHEELERINVLRCKSHEAASIVGPCRMVMIDANHNYAEVAKDIAIWRPHMLPGGIFAGDDYSEGDFPGVVQAVKENVPGYEVQGTTWRVFT
jgi:cephalosporin hydroxylase